MIGKILKVDTFYSFEIDGREYTYINRPLSAMSCTGRADNYTMSGTSNFLCSNQVLSELSQSLESLDEAFKLVKKWKDTEDDYIYGIVKDYENKTIYYDDDTVLKHMEQNKPHEFIFFENKIKVKNWNGT